MVSARRVLGPQGAISKGWGRRMLHSSAQLPVSPGVPAQAGCGSGVGSSGGRKPSGVLLAVALVSP